MTQRQRVNQLGDEQLMELMRSGRVDALTELYDRYGVRAYRVAFAICRDEHRTHDAVQAAFVSLWKSRDSYETMPGTVVGRLLVAAYRAAQEAVRTEASGPVRNAEPPAGSRLPRGASAASMRPSAEAEALLELLAALPDDQQEVILLALYGQLSHAEITALLGLSTDAVKGRMRLGLQQLRNPRAEHGPSQTAEAEG